VTWCATCCVTERPSFRTIDDDMAEIEADAEAETEMPTEAETEAD